MEKIISMLDELLEKIDSQNLNVVVRGIDVEAQIFNLRDYLVELNDSDLDLNTDEHEY
jgi:hypothetical protein